METWKSIPGFDNYMASSEGRIRSNITGKIMRVTKDRPDKKGYFQLSLTMSTQRRITRKVHKLVCLAFHGLPPTEVHTVNHKDGNKLNNVPENLEWATRSEQNYHRFHDLNQIIDHPKGYGNHPSANYTDDEVREIRKLHRQGYGYHRIRAKMGNKTSWVAIQMLVTGKTYKHVPD